MLEESGSVIEVREGVTLIKAARTTACDSCASKSVCYSVSETDMVIEALNPIGAKVGDDVVFTVSAAAIVKTGVMVYLIPLIAFIFGVTIGQIQGWIPAFDRDIVSAFLGFLFLTITYLAIWFYGKTKVKSYMPTIVRKV